MAARGVIGTAGHIDHGKTSLVRALTGIDTDRLPEEKARGITIELGFAHLALPGGRVVGVVDVPGHERYVRAMVAGAVGIDLVVLVVAADEGVMPQTREHLDICGLLGVGRGVVALTKVDLVDPELRSLAESDVRQALVGTFLEDAPLVACSVRTGEGLDALRGEIEKRLDEPARRGEWPALSREQGGLLRLPLDRVFSMKGFGSVVTGTLWSGRVAVGDEVSVPGGEHGKVRGIQVHGEGVQSLDAGARVALNVALSKESLERGMTLGHAGALEPGRVIDAALRLLPSTRRALRRRSRVLLHAGTTQVEAVVRLLAGETLEPGGTALVEIEAHEPLVLVPGDRFVLRGFELQKGHGTTLGGGVVIRTLGSRSRRGRRTEPALLAETLAAHARGDVAERTRLEIARAGELGLGRSSLRRRLPWSDAALSTALQMLSTARAIVRYDTDVYIDSTSLGALELRATAAVLAAGEVPRESVRSRVTDDPRLLALVIERLVERQVIRRDRELLMAPRTIEDATSARLERRLVEAGLEPPRIVELAVLLDVTPQVVDKSIATLVRAGRAVRLKELCYAQATLDALSVRLVAYLEAHGTITPQAWKTLTGVSRKFGIPLAEHFDAVRLTLRVGDDRKLRR
ncbi:MAG: selenocysteine-specific translation elongation factor [Polyangia bacterium]